MSSGDRPFSMMEAPLRPLHTVPGWPEYLGRTWQARDFTLALAVSRVRAATRGQRLGASWVVLSPLLEGLAYYVAFGVILSTGRGIDNFIAYLVVGIFLFRLVSATLVSTARSIERNRRLAQTLVRPRLTLALAGGLQELVRFVPAVLAMLLIVWVVPPGEPLRPALLALLPCVALTWLFGVGLGLLVARLVHGAADVANLLPFVTRIWLFTSGVFYSLDRFEPGSTMRTVLEVNPAYVSIDIARASVLDGRVAGAGSWLLLLLWATVALTVGLVAFRRGETRFGRG